jgi:hypothetical protein
MLPLQTPKTSARTVLHYQHCGLSEEPTSPILLLTVIPCPFIFVTELPDGKRLASEDHCTTTIVLPGFWIPERGTSNRSPMSGFRPLLMSKLRLAPPDADDLTLRTRTRHFAQRRIRTMRSTPAFTAVHGLPIRKRCIGLNLHID